MDKEERLQEAYKIIAESKISEPWHDEHGYEYETERELKLSQELRILESAIDKLKWCHDMASTEFEDLKKELNGDDE